MVKMIGATLCGVALSISAADIAFNSPISWGTVRSNDVTTSFIVDSALIGSPITLTLSENVDGKKTTVLSKKIIVESINNEFTFPVSKPVPGGTGYHSISWKVNDESGEIAPFGIAPVSNKIDKNAIPVIQTSEEVTAASHKTLKGTSPVTLDNNSVAFAWNPKSLSVLVTGTGKVTVALDPSNSKGSFIAYANRSVTVDFDKSSINYGYYTRELSKSKILFSKKEWSGDMKGSITEGVAIISIPWYELGAKPFTGRQMGVLIKNEDSFVPQTAIPFAPATWGNFILK